MLGLVRKCGRQFLNAKGKKYKLEDNDYIRIFEKSDRRVEGGEGGPYQIHY